MKYCANYGLYGRNIDKNDARIIIQAPPSYRYWDAINNTNPNQYYNLKEIRILIYQFKKDLPQVSYTVKVSNILE